MIRFKLHQIQHIKKDVPWGSSRRNLYVNKQSSTQQLLKRALRRLLSENALYNVRKEVDLSRQLLELDIYYPKLNLAFEFQDSYHYFTTWYTQKTKEEITQRDEQKKRLANERGITLIQVPFWWDGTLDTLVETIRSERSDLNIQYLPVNAQPIPKDPPDDIVEKYNKTTVPGVGETIQATFLTDKVDPTGWMLFEKYDGIRAIWNCNDQKFYSRNGNEYRIPENIIDKLVPTHLRNNSFLDGEFWFGRGKFSLTQRIVGKSDSRLIPWEDLKYIVFDYPGEPSLSYKERYKLLESLIPAEDNHIQLAKYVLCEGKDHLHSYSKKLMEEGAEGIILRNPMSVYKQGKSKDFLKFKVFRDAEAKVVSQVNANTWICELPNGTQFEAPGEPEFLKECDIVVGDVVSFKYTQYNLATHKPISPTIYRIRTDITWEEICHQAEKKSKDHVVSVYRSFDKPRNQSRVDRGYWVDISHRKKIFDDFAALKGFDPQVPENWYNVRYNDLREVKGPSVLYHYKNSLKDALREVYPNLKFDFSKFNTGFNIQQYHDPSL